MNHVALKRLYWTADKKRVVDVASAEAGYLFRALGHTVSQEEVDQYGLANTGMVRPVNAPAESAKAETVGEITEEEGETTEDEAEAPEAKAETEVPNHKAVLEVPSKKNKK